MDISVVVPLYNEVESLPELNAWIDRVMKAGHLFTYEIWFIDDGSNDGSWRWVEEQSKRISPTVKGVRFRRNYGKSAALHTGFEEAEPGMLSVTMDADLAG